MKRRGRPRGLGRARLERLQRGQAVLDRLPGDGAPGGGAARAWRPTAALGLALLGALAVAVRAVALLVPAARAGAAVAGGRRQRAAARAVARARAAAGRARRLRLLHRLLLGHALLPPAHGRAVDELHPLLAAGGHQLRPHQRQRARAGAEDGDGAQRGRRCWPRSRARGQRAPRSPSAALVAAALGALAWRRFERDRLPAYPAAPRSPRRPPAARRAPRLRDRGRRRQPRAPVAGPHARRWTGWRARAPSTWPWSPPTRPARSSASRRCSPAPRRAEHGMRSNFAPRLGVRRESVFDTLERAGTPGPPGGHRAPARPVRRGRRPLGHLRAAHRARSTTRSPPPAARWSRRRTPTCWCSSCWPPTSSATCAARATPSTSSRSRRPTAASATSSPSSAERGKLDGATVILMADHGQGRGIGGHGHMDWGETPGAVRGLGPGRGARARSAASRARCASWRSPSRELLGVDAPAAARGRSLVPAVGSRGAHARRAGGAAWRSWWRATSSRGIGAVLAAAAGARPAGMDVDVLVVDDGSEDRTARHRPRRPGRRCSRTPTRAAWARRCAPASSTRATRATTPPSTSTATASTTPPSCRTVLDPVARGRADYVVGSRFLGAARRA